MLDLNTFPQDKQGFEAIIVSLSRMTDLMTNLAAMVAVGSTAW